MSMYTNILEMQTRYEESELIQLTDFEEPYQHVINEDVINSAITDASAEIDLYLASRYQLPLSHTPEALKRLASTIVYYQLHRGRHSEYLRQQYEDTLKVLEKISKGIIKLSVGSIAGSNEPKSAAAIAKVDAPDRTFNRDSLKGF